MISQNHSNSSSIDIPTIKEEILNNIDMDSFLEYFEITEKTMRQRDFSCPCPIHNGEHHNFRIFFKNRDGSPMFHWTCFSHNCHDGYAQDIIGFAMAIMQCSFEKALEFLMNFADITSDNIDFENSKEKRKCKNDLMKICLEIDKTNFSTEDTRVKHKLLTEDFVKRSLKRRNGYFTNRGFTKNVLDIFEVGHCSPPDSGWDYCACPYRAVIPIRDENLKLVGISGRAETDNIQNDDAKYKILSGSDKEGTLYGLCYSKPYIIETGTVIIVEGFCDLWKCWMAGYKNVVAVMGKTITETQLLKLIKHAKRALICFDFDNGRNKESAYETGKTLSAYMSTHVAFISDKNDIGGSSLEEIATFFKKNSRFI